MVKSLQLLTKWGILLIPILLIFYVGYFLFPNKDLEIKQEIKLPEGWMFAENPMLGHPIFIDHSMLLLALDGLDLSTCKEKLVYIHQSVNLIYNLNFICGTAPLKTYFIKKHDLKISLFVNKERVNIERLENIVSDDRKSLSVNIHGNEPYAWWTSWPIIIIFSLVWVLVWLVLDSMYDSMLKEKRPHRFGGFVYDDVDINLPDADLTPKERIRNKILRFLRDWVFFK